ncbi:MULTISPECIES: IclR family transcriptional regulator [Leucobacter]|uniref:Helix-turn-helix domain-containing protein n=1 Tax=Leucobacter manosquensis TaxID=2810611 RepID=A0ABS5M6F1_9MICO|nr:MULTISPECIES: helix-turn-helix domain-containing protein [Leucobacter]MBS3182251.1 helix-turn-helix domain-containing protein [Leucobacter manosquensis]
MSEIVPGTSGTAPLTSNLKMLRLLEEIAKTSAPFGVSEIARRVGGSRSMVHRQLVTLVAAGWLQTDSQGAYSLTFAPVRVAQAALRHASVDQRIAEELTRLASELGEGTSLGTLDGDSVTIVGRGLPPRNVHVSLEHGQRFGIAGSALGSVLASYLPDDDLDRLRRAKVELPTPAECAKVRGAGYAMLVDDEFDPIEIVAVPVGRTSGRVRFALSAHWPHGRTKPDHVISTLEAGARAIEDLTVQSAGILLT